MCLKSFHWFPISLNSASSVSHTLTQIRLYISSPVHHVDLVPTSQSIHVPPAYPVHLPIGHTYTSADHAVVEHDPGLGLKQTDVNLTAGVKEHMAAACTC